MRQFGRKAYGAQRITTPAQQAANVVRSIREHQARGIQRTPADYQVSGTLLTVVEQMLRQAA